MQTLVKNDEEVFIQDHWSQDYCSRRERLNTTQNATGTRGEVYPIGRMR